MQNFDPMAYGAKPITNESTFDPMAYGAKPITEDQKPTEQMGFKDKIKYLQSLPKEERKQKLGLGELIYQQSRNLGKEKSAAQKVIEGIGTAAGFAGQVALEAIGKKVAGKKGSAAGAATATTLRGVARESFQNVTGYQDEPPIEAMQNVFVDAASAAAVDAAVNFAFDDVIPAVKKKVLEIPLISTLTGKGKAAMETLSGEIVAKGGKAYESLSETVGDVRKFFLDSGMPKIKWWENAKNQYGKFEPLGVVVNKTRIAELSKQLDPILEQAGKNGTILSYVDAEELFGKQGKKSFIKSLQNSGLDESALRVAQEDGGKLLADVLAKIKKGGLKPKDAKKIATELFEGTYTTAGKERIGISPTAQRQVGAMLSKWIKDSVPGAKEILSQQANLYRLNDLVSAMAPKVQKEIGKDVFMNLSKEQIANLSYKTLFSLGLLGSGAYVGEQSPALGTALTTAGVVAGVGQIPALRTAVAGGSEKALYNQMKEQVPSMTKEVVGATGRTILQRLVGQN